MKYIVRSVDGDEYGPFSREELRNLVREDRLGPGDFIRREVGKTWSPFEKIAGLGDDLGIVTKESSVEMHPTTPTRPTVGAEVVGNGTSTARPVQPAPEVEETSLVEDDPAPEMPLDSRPQITTEVEPLAMPGEPNPFLAHGLPISMGTDEEVHFVAAQSFIDAFRDSMFNAILGHRAIMICTSRRIAVVRPSSLRPSMEIAWIESIGSVAIQSRRNLFRMVIGILLLLYAISSLLGGVIGAFASSMAGGAGFDGSLLALTSSAGLVIASVVGPLGLLAFLTARQRAMVVGSNGTEIVYACRALGPWHLAQVDAARLSSPIASPAGDRISPPTSFREG